MQNSNLSSGQFHNCQTSPLKKLVCWGWAQQSLTTPPPEFKHDLYMTSAGFRHNCTIDTRKKITCWGKDTALNNYINKLTDKVLQVSTGFMHVCIITSTGKLQCYGHNFANQCDIPGVLVDAETVQVAAGSTHTCAIDQLQQLHCWGYPQNVIKSDKYNSSSEVNINKLNAQQVATGQQHSCVITDSSVLNANLHCWGSNKHGQLDVPLRLSMEAEFTIVDLGSYHSCGIEDVKLHCWGSNQYRQAHVPSSMEILSIMVSSGDRHSCALNLYGVIECWGNNEQKQLDIPRDTINNDQDQTIKSGGRHTCQIFPVLRNLKCWGGNRHGEGRVPLGYEQGVTDVGVGFAHTCVILNKFDRDISEFKNRSKHNKKRKERKEGEMDIDYQNDLGRRGKMIDGNDQNDQANHGIYPHIVYNNVNSFQRHKSYINNKNQVSENIDINFKQNVSKSTTQGDNNINSNYFSKGQNNNSSSTSEISADFLFENEHFELNEIKPFITDDDDVLEADNELKCWGWDQQNQVNDQDLIKVYNPVIISSGQAHNCTVTIFSVVQCWGLNQYAQCDIPMSVTSISNSNTNSNSVSAANQINEYDRKSYDLKHEIQSISLGLGHTCLLSKLKGIICWGLNNFNQLNQHISKTTTQLLSMESSFNSTCVLDFNSNLNCWGSKDQEISYVDQQSVGQGNICMIVDDNFRCQGMYTDELQLDDQLRNNHNVKSFAAGKNQVCIVSSEGVINCEGENNLDQCKIPKELQ